MDDLLEIILDIGGEVLELLLERILDKHSSGGTAGEKDPWERIQPVPSWEQTVTRLPWER